ncbi:endonuclease VII domain-containing protein [bacterium]|nr:endonuclease VII domain-containing protein [bacterium]
MSALVKRFCSVCEIQFRLKDGFRLRSGRRKKFCSPQCIDIYRQSQEIQEKKCKECGVSFVGIKYCSASCRYKHRDEIHQKRLASDSQYKEQHHIKVSAQHLTRHHGMNLHQFKKMLISQDHKCAICGCGLDKRFKTRISVDHDHISGNIRSLLCHHCNSAIGFLKDDPILALKAARYLKKHQLKVVAS